MYPTFNVRGDYLLISRRHDQGKDIKVGDVVRFSHPSFLGVHGAKRVLGLPGDFVCKDPAFSTNVGEEDEMIQVGLHSLLLPLSLIDTDCTASPERFLKDMSFSPETTYPGREILGITDLCLWD